MVSEKTAHNYLNAGLFDADKMDCPRIIRMRPRRSTPKLKIDRHCYEGRTYEDFMRFIADNPDVPVVQMDSVIGNKSGKVLLSCVTTIPPVLFWMYSTTSMPCLDGKPIVDSFLSF